MLSQEYIKIDKNYIYILYYNKIYQSLFINHIKTGFK